MLHAPLASRFQITIHLPVFRDATVRAGCSEVAGVERDVSALLNFPNVDCDVIPACANDAAPGITDRAFALNDRRSGNKELGVIGVQGGDGVGIAALKRCRYRLVSLRHRLAGTHHLTFLPTLKIAPILLDLSIRRLHRLMTAVTLSVSSPVLLDCWEKETTGAGISASFA
jgi:hypothetical protein